MATESNQPTHLTGSELIKEASRIKEFTGKDYDLSSFIREVELILPLFNNNIAMQRFIFERYVKNKIQGPALAAIRTLGQEATWPEIKEEPIKNFGIKETYHNLYHQAVNLRNYNVSNYFYNLRNILDKLNTKYEQDNNKPPEFNPSINESLILKTFLNGIEPNLASIIYSRNITCLRSGYYLLEETGMVKRYDGRPNLQNRFIPNNRQQSQYLPQHRVPQNNNLQTSTNNNNSNNPYNNSGQLRQNNNSPNNNSGLFRQQFQNSQRTRQSQNNKVTQMEVDHIETNDGEEVNFQYQAENIVYR
ncbi:homeobox protein 2-like [Bactrocera dorsalis]|uniref:Homeobox protein 2-like n=1 Tax=Bactrocera dorsalis TaxID=27457 RepID=A0ABM3K2R0_BACDO|nr:homeobox protein 2-like [Bactrocera dorsalis]